jgi:hypothetical protein
MGHLMPAIFANTIDSVSLMLVYEYLFIGAIAGLYNQRSLVSNASYRISHPVTRRYQLLKQKAF